MGALVELFIRVRVPGLLPGQVRLKNISIMHRHPMLLDGRQPPSTCALGLQEGIVGDGEEPWKNCPDGAILPKTKG